MVTFCALSSILHLVVLSVDRYLMVCKPFIAGRIHSTYWNCVFALLLAWLLALLFSIFPLLGRSRYALEADGMRCSIDWNSESLKDRFYVMLLFAFCFLLPILIMSYSFFSVHRELRRMQSRAGDMFGLNSRAATDVITAERRNMRLAIILCSVFLLTWSPYAIISFWTAFFQHLAKVPVVLSTTAALIAKSSTIVNPLIYSFWNKVFRDRLQSSAVCKCLARKSRVHEIEST